MAGGVVVFSDGVGKGEDEGGDGVGCGPVGIHCFAIFFSTNSTLRMISKTMNPNAI